MSDASHQRRSWADTGFHRLAQCLLILQAVILLADGLAYARLGLSFRWSPHGTIAAISLALILGLWIYFHLEPGPASDAVTAEGVFVVFLVMLFSAIASPAQYAAVAAGWPYADPWLAAADASMHVDVRALALWTNAHPVVARGLWVGYQSFLPQVLVTMLGLIALKRRDRLWEFAFHFQICLTMAVAALVLWPAMCPPAYLGFASTIDMSHLIGQIRGFHDGQLRAISFDELEGLVSFPSFHVAGALAMVWAFRGIRRVQWPLIAVNVVLVLATFLTGVHYLTDVLGALPLFALSLVAFRRWGRRLLHV